MIVDDAATFFDGLPVDHPLLGIDLGTKTIGLALSDRRLQIASPLRTIKRSKFIADATEIRSLVSEREIVGIVLGLPRNMDGSEGPRAQSTRAFATNLHNMLVLPVLLWDERLSTVAAERALLEADTSRKRRAEVIDHVAAGVILQGALDRLGYLRGQEDE